MMCDAAITPTMPAVVKPAIATPPVVGSAPLLRTNA